MLRLAKLSQIRADWTKQKYLVILNWWYLSTLVTWLSMGDLLLVISTKKLLWFLKFIIIYFDKPTNSDITKLLILGIIEILNISFYNPLFFKTFFFSVIFCSETVKFETSGKVILGLFWSTFKWPLSCLWAVMGNASYRPFKQNLKLYNHPSSKMAVSCPDRAAVHSTCELACTVFLTDYCQKSTWRLPPKPLPAYKFVLILS